jgi:hypothetical protein
MALLRCARQGLVDRHGPRPHTYAITIRGLRRLAWFQGTASEPTATRDRPAGPRPRRPHCPVCLNLATQPAVRCSGCGLHAHVGDGMRHAGARGSCGVFEIDPSAPPLAHRTPCRCGGCGRAALVVPGTRCAVCKDTFYDVRPT